MQNLMRDIHGALREREYWAELLGPVVDALDSSTQELDGVLAMQGDALLERVRDLFNEMYSSYLNVCRWFATIQDQGDIPEGVDRLSERLSWWKESHLEFFDRLQDLHQDPGHNKTLKIFLGPLANRYLARLMNEAETSQHAGDKDVGT
jgi:hypothetical protein